MRETTRLAPDRGANQNGVRRLTADGIERLKLTLHIAPRSFAFTVLLGLFAALPALSVDMSAPTLALLPAALGTTPDTRRAYLVSFHGRFRVGTSRRRRAVRRTTDDDRSCWAAWPASRRPAPPARWPHPGTMLIICRLIQGFGAGSCAVIAFAMVQDLFEGDAARAKRSYVTVIFVAVPMLAPALGSVLMNLFGWRSVFGVLAIGGRGTARRHLGWRRERASRLATTAPVSTSHRSGQRTAVAGLPVRSHLLANALSYGAIFAYIAGSPVVIIGQMGRSSAVFAAVFACTAAALAAGAWTSGRLSRRGVDVKALLDPSLLAAAAATFALAAVSLSGITSGAVLIPLLLAVLYARGIIAPNLQHLAIERQRRPGRRGVRGRRRFAIAVGRAGERRGGVAVAVVRPERARRNHGPARRRCVGHLARDQFVIPGRKDWLTARHVMAGRYKAANPRSGNANKARRGGGVRAQSALAIVSAAGSNGHARRLRTITAYSP